MGKEIEQNGAEILKQRGLDGRFTKHYLQEELQISC